MMENAISILIVIFSVQLQQTEISERKLFIFHLGPLLTIGRTVLKESNDLVVLRVTFDSKMTFEKHLRSVSRAALQRLGILRKSECFMIDRFLGDAFGVLSCQFWSIVLQSGACHCSAADTHLEV